MFQREMMRNIKLVLEYDGTNYHGWQTQPNLPTIQGAVEEALAQLTKTSVRIVGAGRTDTGVHAEGQVANFHTDLQIPIVAFQKGLNTLLPRDIVVCAVTEVDADFHSRFSATSRRYRYTILNRTYRSALMRHTSYFYSMQIDVVLADAICRSIVGKKDFSSFQKTGSDRLNPVCQVFEACCWKEDQYVYFEIEANSFLRGMVRAIVGTILKSIKNASGNVEKACVQFHNILEAKDRALAGPSVPAHGLSLIRVEYNDK
ncbi:MAG: tRNA pseudouridine(38-40) synthase TruA [Candidatus Poribacteria bacterium]|nr:tRNA pseudouridine(38-40) synthase TruA [Candidatus Poribacteria bacterium]